MVFTKEELIRLIPEIEWIEDQQLRQKTIETWQLALEESGTSIEEFPAILCHKSLDGCKVTLLDHTRGVTKLARALAQRLDADFGQFVPLNHDLVVMGAILHDVGKVLEHVTGEDGKLTWAAQYLHHPTSGAILAGKTGCPPKTVYIIANHSHEGKESKDIPELFIVRNADEIYYKYLFFGFQKKAKPGW